MLVTKIFSTIFCYITVCYVLQCIAFIYYPTNKKTVIQSHKSMLIEKLN